MRQREKKDPVLEQVDAILDDLLPRILGAAGGEIDPDVEDWWRNQYRAKFYFAILKRNKDYAADREQLQKRARRLGKFARSLAPKSTITTLHAAIASHATDCVPVGSGGTEEEWCN